MYDENTQEFLKHLTALTRKFGIVIIGTYDGAEIEPINKADLTPESRYVVYSTCLDWENK